MTVANNKIAGDVVKSSDWNGLATEHNDIVTNAIRKDTTGQTVKQWFNIQGTGVGVANDAVVMLKDSAGTRQGYWGKDITSSGDMSITNEVAGGHFRIRLTTGGTFKLTINGADNTVWHSGNDGAGSTLDADLLDGLEASVFMKKTADSALNMNGNDITGVKQFALNGTITPSITNESKYGTQGWNKVLNMVSSQVLMWGKGASSYSAGIGKTDDNNLYIMTSTADDGSVLVNYPFIFELNNSKLKINGSYVLTTADEGTGKGIDADTVDGLEASAFALTGHNHSGTYLGATGGALTGNLDFKSDAEKILTFYKADGTTVHGKVRINTLGDMITSTLAGRTLYFRPNGDASTTGEIAMSTTGITVGGVAVSLSTHNHDTAYLSKAGNTGITGQFVHNRADNTVPLILQGASTGWASGMWLDNTTATTGKKWGIYAGSLGHFYIGNVTAGTNPVMVDGTNGNMTLTGALICGNATIGTAISGNAGNIASSYDEWLRLNDGDSHTNGIYCGSTLLRTDGTLQVGNNGASFYANSGGANFGVNVGMAGSLDMIGGAWIGKTTAYGSSRTITLAVGDADSGLNWGGDGDIRLMSNGVSVASATAGAFRINGYTVSIGSGTPSAQMVGHVWIQV